MKTCLILAVALSLTACASTEQQRVTDIAGTPLRDFNLSSSAIPPVLAEAKKQPYLAPYEQSCEALQLQVGQLDEVLGPDVDADPAAELGKGDKARNAVGNAAVGALQKTVEGAIPFRGWVRKLSGAERHSDDVAAAIAAGTARRAFLKGIAFNKSCQAPVVARR
jgi:hypothetical protein